jgi:hypothetical protein
VALGLGLARLLGHRAAADTRHAMKRKVASVALLVVGVAGMAGCMSPRSPMALPS